MPIRDLRRRARQCDFETCRIGLVSTGELARMNSLQQLEYKLLSAINRVIKKILKYLNQENNSNLYLVALAYNCSHIQTETGS